VPTRPQAGSLRVAEVLTFGVILGHTGTQPSSQVTAGGAAARFINHACGEWANLRPEEFRACAAWGDDTPEGRAVPIRVPTRATKCRVLIVWPTANLFRGGWQQRPDPGTRTFCSRGMHRV